MRGWAIDFLSQPWPLVTFVLLAAIALAVHRRVARGRGWPAWPTLGLLLSLAVVLTLTLPPAPHMLIGVPGIDGVDQCFRSLSDTGGLWHAVVATTERGERVGNILMFVPLTFFGLLVSRRPVLVAGAGVLLSAAIEVAQSVMHLGRECVGYDWVNNAIGAVLGVVLGILAIRVSSR
ncbi:VanZ family protein [Phytohabitans kaempferiae]|uniref:VanZ family protein n=1 Tax=Phytohabitans kaempferiae TaxID=1620943 RepID=A0ABV6ME37_9ACTN